MAATQTVTPMKKNMNSKFSSPALTQYAKSNSNISASLMKSLTRRLPLESLTLFDVVRCGETVGVKKVCPFCGDKCPDWVKPWNRATYMMVHIAGHVKDLPTVKELKIPKTIEGKLSVVRKRLQ